MRSPRRRESPCRRGRIAAALAAVGALVCGCATYAPPEAPPVALVPATPEPVQVYIAYNGFHAGLIVPTSEILKRPGATAKAVGRLAPRAWTGLGYGDSKFYQQAGINPARVLDFFRSMFAPGNPSVVQVRGLADPLTDEGHPHLVRLSLPPRDFDRLVAHVDSAFLTEGGEPVFVAPGRDSEDADFFRGRTPASATHECNQWLGEVLGAAGVPHSYLADTASTGLAADLVASGRAVRIAPPSPPGSTHRSSLETPPHPQLGGLPAPRLGLPRLTAD